MCVSAGTVAFVVRSIVSHLQRKLQLQDSQQQHLQPEQQHLRPHPLAGPLAASALEGASAVPAQASARARGASDLLEIHVPSQAASLLEEGGGGARNGLGRLVGHPLGEGLDDRAAGRGHAAQQMAWSGKHMALGGNQELAAVTGGLNDAEMLVLDLD